MEKSAFVRAIDGMLASKRVRKRGQRRATRYFVAGAKASNAKTDPVSFAVTRWKMSERQSQVLEHLAQGKANLAIAKALGCGVKTIEQHVGLILKKARVKNRAELVARIWQQK